MRYGSICSGIEAATVATAHCLNCHLDKPATAFHRRGTGLQRWCKECGNSYQRATRLRRETPERRRRGNLKARYDLTPDQVAAMLAQQGGICAICLVEPKRAVVDHDHATRKVRGVLCHRCNIRLPAVEDAAFRDASLRYLARKA